MTNETKPAEWAVQRAIELVGSHLPSNRDFLRSVMEGNAYLRAFARYIEAHEEPPADPVQILDDIIRQRFHWHNAGKGVAEELRARGIELANSDDRATEGRGK